MFTNSQNCIICVFVLLVEPIVRCRLVDRQPNLIEAGNLHNAAAPIVVHIVVREVRYNLAQCNNVRIAGLILGEIVVVHCNRLVRRRLTSLAVQAGPVPVAGEQIVMDPGAQ